MDLRQLEVFLGVIEHGTVTRASEKLYLSPGAVSLQLKNLAAELKTELFVRSGKNIVPTSDAHRLAVHARDLLKKMRDIRQDFEKSPDHDRHSFHLASSATTLIYRMGPPLRQVRRRYPHADVHVTVAPTEKIVAGLLDRSYDLGLISLPLDNPALTILPLYEEELLIIRPRPEPVRGSSVETVQPAVPVALTVISLSARVMLVCPP